VTYLLDVSQTTPSGENLFPHTAAGQKFFPERGITGVIAAPDRSARDGRLFPDPAHLDTQVMRFQIHRHAMRMQHRVEGVRHLLPDPFLDSKPLGKQVHQPRQLGDADDVLVGDVANVRIPEKGEGVMLA